MKELNLKKLGKNIAKARKESGLTQRELADVVGVSDRVCGFIEQGIKKPGLETAYRIANTLDTTIDELIGR